MYFMRDYANNLNRRTKMTQEKDIMKELCIRQGYVKSSCTMPGQMVFALMNSTGDPCRGCNEDRNVCHGRASRNERIDYEKDL